MEFVFPPLYILVVHCLILNWHLILYEVYLSGVKWFCQIGKALWWQLKIPHLGLYSGRSLLVLTMRLVRLPPKTLLLLPPWLHLRKRLQLIFLPRHFLRIITHSNLTRCQERWVKSTSLSKQANTLSEHVDLCILLTDPLKHSIDFLLTLCPRILLWCLNYSTLLPNQVDTWL